MPPLYTYLNEQTGETRDVFQGMNDDHSFSEGGIAWRRVYYSPQMSIDTKVDPYSAKDFTKATNKKGTIGDMMDLSAELSNKRADKEGADPVKQKHFQDYEKKNKKKHLLDKPKVIENNIAKIEF
jgi:predicted nucleic acid-binding Zn ribbon protein